MQGLPDEWTDMAVSREADRRACEHMKRLAEYERRWYGSGMRYGACPDELARLQGHWQDNLAFLVPELGRDACPVPRDDTVPWTAGGVQPVFMENTGARWRRARPPCVPRD